MRSAVFTLLTLLLLLAAIAAGAQPAAIISLEPVASVPLELAAPQRLTRHGPEPNRTIRYGHGDLACRLDVVGLTPSALARVLRFRRAWEAAPTVERNGWTVLAIDAGYADQSHMIRDFRAFAGRPPSRIAATPKLRAQRTTGDR